MKIAAKISFSFLGVAIILSSVAAPIFYVIAKNSLRNEIVAHLDTTAKSRKEHVETYLKLIGVSVKQLSASVVLENFLKTTKDDPARNEAFNLAMRRLKTTKEYNPSVCEFLLLDLTGRVVASSDEADIGPDDSTDAFFVEGRKGSYIKDAYYCPYDGEPLIAASAPILEFKTGKLLGVLVATFTLDELNKIVSDRTGLGRTGEIYIVNKYGYMITPSRFLENTFLKQKVDTENFKLSVPHIDEEKSPMPLVVSTDYRGKMILGTHAFIPEMQWSILTEINADEAFAPLVKIRVVFLIVLFLVPLAAWLLGTAISLAITRPIHHLHKGTEIIGAGNLDYKVGTPAKDEIGQLSRAFDAMTQDLKKTTVSIGVLDKEIAERKNSEERIRKINQVQTVLLDPAALVDKLKRITDGVVNVFNADFARIWLIGKGDRCDSGCVHAAVTEGPHVCRYRDQCLHLVASSGRYIHTDGGVHARVPFGCYKIGGIASGEYPSFLTNDVVRDPRVHNHEWAKELGLVSFVGFQLKPPHGKVIGVLALFSRNIISSEEYAQLENIASIAVRAILVEQSNKVIVESEAKYKTLYEFSSDAIMMLIPEKGFIAGNPSTVKMFGCKDEEEFIKQNPASLSPEYQPDGGPSMVKAQEMMAIAMEKGSHFFEWTHRRMDTREFYATVLLTRVELDGAKVLQATVRDITESKTAEEKLKLYTQRLQVQDKNLRSVIINSVDGIVIVDKDKKVRFLNPVAETILGRKSQEITGQLFGFSLVPGETAEINIMRKAGTSIIVEMRIAETSWEGEQAHLISLRDITERKQVEEGFKRVNKELKRLDQMKSEFIATVSHELRTPLTSIREGVSQVLDGILGETTKEQEEFLNISLSNIDRLKRIIDNLLDISKIEAGKVELNKELVDIVSLAKEVSLTFAPLAKSKGIEIKTLFPGEAIKIYADKDRIIQVFTNLVNNALKFTQQGYIEIAILDKGDNVECHVSDTGRGISEEDLPKTFNRFQQFGREAGSGEKGTGLGLPIAKGILEMHFGSIRAESQLKKGTKFTFTLPKYSKDEIVRENIEGRIRQAQTDKRGIVLFISRLDNYSDIKDIYTEERAQEILLEILEALESATRAGDLVSIGKKNEIIVLAEVEKKDINRMNEKLKRTIKESVFSAQKEFKLEFSYSCVSYPEDAADAKGLLESAHANLISETTERAKKYIMVADDEPVVLSALKKLLTSVGYSNLIEAHDGSEALEKTKALNPDLIILDMKMPKTSGYDVIGKLKEDTKTKDIPILIMSGFEIEKDRLGPYIKEREIPIMEKPVDIEKLKSLVSYLL